MVIGGGALGCLWLCRSQCLWTIRLLPLITRAGLARLRKSAKIVQTAVVASLSTLFHDLWAIIGVLRVIECTSFDMFTLFHIGFSTFSLLVFSSSTVFLSVFFIKTLHEERFRGLMGLRKTTVFLDSHNIYQHITIYVKSHFISKKSYWQFNPF